MTYRPWFTALAAGVVLSACEPAGSGNVLDIEAASFIDGLALLDANASGRLESEDLPAAGLRIALVLVNTSDTVARATTGADGRFRFAPVPVGTYEVVVTNSALGDSLQVVFRDPPGSPVSDIGPDDTTTVTVGVLDSTVVRIGVSFPIVDIARARSSAIGRRLFVRAVVSGGTAVLGDGSVFLQDPTGAIRALNVSGVVAPGDSVLVLGRSATQNGRPVLANATLTPIQGGAAVDTIPVTAGRARTADGGILDAQLVRARELFVADTGRVGGTFVITAEDPSGTVEIGLRTDGSFDLGAYPPGADLDVTGLLVPNAGIAGEWRLRPRNAADLVIR